MLSSESRLLHPRGKREDADIRFRMHCIVHNPAENNKKWDSFMHTHDTQGTLPVQNKCLLKCVLKAELFQFEFFGQKSKERQPVTKICLAPSVGAATRGFLQFPFAFHISALESSSRVIGGITTSKSHISSAWPSSIISTGCSCLFQHSGKGAT